MDFESQLTAFQPKSVAVNRDQLMFDAGLAAARAEILTSSVSQRRSLRLWQSVTAALMLVSSGLGTAMLTRSEPETRIVYIERERLNSTAEIPFHSDSTTAQEAIGIATSAKNQNETIRDLEIGSLRELEIVHARNIALAQVLKPDSTSKISKPASHLEMQVERLLPTQPLLSPSALMMNQKSRNWINRLIEEPTL